MSAGRVGIHALAVVLATVIASCGGSSPGAASATGDVPTRPQRLADHETEPDPSTTTVVETEPEDGPAAQPPPVEPPFEPTTDEPGAEAP